MPEFISEARRLRQITHLPMAGYKKEQTTLPGVNFPISYCVAELCNGSTYDSDSYRLGSNPSSAAISRWASRQLSHLKDQVGFLLFYYHSSSPRKLACCAYALTSAVMLGPPVQREEPFFLTRKSWNERLRFSAEERRNFGNGFCTGIGRISKSLAIAPEFC